MIVGNNISWPSRTTDLSCAPSEAIEEGRARRWLAAAERWLAAPFEHEALVSFRRFFVVKTCIWTAIVIDKPQRVFTELGAGLTLLLVSIAAALAWRRERYRAGVGILLAFLLYKNVYLYFPMTAVHHYIEILVFAALFFLPPRISAKNEARVEGTQARALQAMMILATFYSGFQKVWQGRWLSGETLAYFGLYDDRNSLLTATLDAGLKVVASALGQAVPPLPLPGPSSLEQVGFWLPGWAAAYFALLSWAAIGAELLFPVLTLFRRTRTLGFIGITATITMVSAGAGVFGFTFTGVSCCLLFFPSNTRRTFPVLFGAMIASVITLVVLRVTHRMPYLWM